MLLSKIKIAQRFILLVVLMAGSFLHAMSQTGPRAVAEEPVKDLGAVFNYEKIKHDFIIHNNGSATLIITDVKPSCGCTTTSFDKLIGPGKTGKISATIDLATFTGPISKGITVFTNDNYSPQIELTIKAKVNSILTAKPGYARYIIVQGDDAVAEISQLITSSDGSSFDITGAESEIKDMKVKYEEATAAERAPDIAGKQWIVKMLLDKNAAVGPLSGYVHIKTNHAKQKTIDIPVSGFVRPVLAVTPPSADFGQITITESLKKILNIRNFSSQPVTVTKAECDVKGIEATLETLTDGREYQVRVTINTTIAKGAFSGKLIIHTNNNKMPVVEVPIKGTVL